MNRTSIGERGKTPTVAQVPNTVLMPIELGAAMFSLTEPFPGETVRYNRWYERDHFFANGQQLPHFFTGRRFVCTRPLKELRYLAPGNPVSADPLKGSFLHLYWILPSEVEDWISIGYQNFADLEAAGRMEGSLRETIHTVSPRFLWASNRDVDGVPAEMALNHPYAGLVVTTSAANSDASWSDLDRWYREEHAPSKLTPGSPIALCISMTPRIMREMPGKFGGRMVSDTSRVDNARFMHFWFLEKEPDAALWKQWFADEAQAVSRSSSGNLEFASAFIPTIPGTDAYLDQL